MNSVREFLAKYLNCDDQPDPARNYPGTPSLHFTPCGLCYLQQWAPLRYSSTAALAMAVFATRFPAEPMVPRLEEWAERQLVSWQLASRT